MGRYITGFFVATLAAVLLTGCSTCDLNKQSLGQVKANRASNAEWLKRPVDADGNIKLPKVLIEIRDASDAKLEANIERAVKDE